MLGKPAVLGQLSAAVGNPRRDGIVDADVGSGRECLFQTGNPHRFAAPDRALIRLDRARKHPQQRTLAAAVAAGDANAFAGTNAEVDAAQHDVFTKLHGEVGDCEDGLLGHCGTG